MTFITSNTQQINGTKTLQRIAIALSREELFVVMRLLKASSLPGFDLSWLQTNEDGSLADETQKLLEVATNGLIARGYLAIKPAEKLTQPPTPLLNVSLPPQVISLVGACAFAEYNVLLSQRVSPGPHLTYLHEYQGLGVVHTMPQQDVHLFELVDGRNGLIAVLHEALSLAHQQALPVPSGDIPIVDMLAARDAALDGQLDEALAFLKRGSLALATSQALTQVLRNATSMGVLLIAERGDDKARGTMTYVTTPDTCFTFTDRTQSGTHAFRVESVSAHTLRNWIEDTLPSTSQKEMLS